MSDRRIDSHERLACTLAFFIDGRWIRVDSHQYVRDFRLSFPSAGCWRGSVTLFDSASTALEQLASRLTPATSASKDGDAPPRGSGRGRPSSPW